MLWGYCVGAGVCVCVRVCVRARALCAVTVLVIIAHYGRRDHELLFESVRNMIDIILSE